MAGEIAGKLLRARLGGDWFKCQMDLTVNLTAATSTDDPCKPDGETLQDAEQWDDPQVDSRGWNVNLNVRNFLENSAPAINQSDVIQYILDGNSTMDLEVMTTPGQHNNPEDVILEGTIIITDFSWNLPAVGKASSDITFLGKGKPTQTRIPVGS